MANSGIPLNPLPFGINTLGEDLCADGCSFDFVNAGGEAVPIINYERDNCLYDLSVMKMLNKGLVNPVNGVAASKNPINKRINKALFSKSACKQETDNEYLIFNEKRFDVGNLNINYGGSFETLQTRQNEGQQLTNLLPSAFDDTTSNAIKYRSIARVQGDTNLNSGFTTLELRENATAFKEVTPKSKQKPNSIEKLTKVSFPRTNKDYDLKTASVNPRPQRQEANENREAFA